MILKQCKSNWYYVFWSICAVAVVAGQIYIGTGYHRFHYQLISHRPNETINTVTTESVSALNPMNDPSFLPLVNTYVSRWSEISHKGWIMLH